MDNTTPTYIVDESHTISFIPALLIICFSVICFLIGFLLKKIIGRCRAVSATYQAKYQYRHHVYANVISNGGSDPPQKPWTTQNGPNAPGIRPTNQIPLPLSTRLDHIACGTAPVYLQLDGGINFVDYPSYPPPLPPRLQWEDGPQPLMSVTCDEDYMAPDDPNTGGTERNGKGRPTTPPRPLVYDVVSDDSATRRKGKRQKQRQRQHVTVNMSPMLVLTPSFIRKLDTSSDHRNGVQSAAPTIVSEDIKFPIPVTEDKLNRWKNNPLFSRHVCHTDIGYLEGATVMMVSGDIVLQGPESSMASSPSPPMMNDRKCLSTMRDLYRSRGQAMSTHLVFADDVDGDIVDTPTRARNPEAGATSDSEINSIYVNRYPTTESLPR